MQPSDTQSVGAIGFDSPIAAMIDSQAAGAPTRPTAPAAAVDKKKSRPLTAATLERIKDGEVLRDQTVPGLHLRAFAKKKVFYLYYKTKAGQERRPKLGATTIMTLAQARDRAKEMLRRVAAGGDPANELATLSERMTMPQLWARYERHQTKRKKPRSMAEDKRLWEKHIKPALGKRFPADVTETDVEALHTSMADTPYQANRVAALLRKMFNLAIKWKRETGVLTNPVEVEFYPEKKRKRVPNIEEAIRLCREIEATRETEPLFIGFVMLVTLTGCRRDEIRTAERAWVYENGLHLPDSKTGEKIVPMNEHAMREFELIPATPGNPYIIPGLLPRACRVNVKDAWKRLRERAGIENLRLHDLRRFFTSAGLSGGLTLEAVGQLLGHRNAQTTKTYAYLLTDAAQAMSQAAGSEVMRRMRGDVVAPGPQVAMAS